MSIVLTRVAVFCAVLLFSTAGFSQSTFNTLLNLYSSGSKPTIEEMKVEALWAGKCATKERPDVRVGGIMNAYPMGSDDPIIGSNALYLTVHRAPDNKPEDYFLSINRDSAVLLHDKIKRDELNSFSPVRDIDDPVVPNNNELFFSHRINTSQGVAGVDFTLRKNVNQNGLNYYIIAGRCPFSRCSGGAVYRDPLVMCYVWVNKLQAAGLSDLEMLQDDNSIPEYLRFEVAE